jgi:antitoxin ParD1/3/4
VSTVRKTITLTRQMDSWVKEQIESGRYANDSECVRDLIRREQVADQELDSIRSALIAGEASGVPEPFDLDEFKRSMRASRG